MDPNFRQQLKGTYIPSDAEIGTPVFHRSGKGELVLIWYHKDRSCAIAAGDEGRSWSDWPEIQTWPQAGVCGILQTTEELLYFGTDKTHSWYEGTPQVWRSGDEGRTWTGGRRMTGDTGAWACLNDRVVITSTGRIIVPVDHLLGREGPDPDQIGTIVSDDGGQNWNRKETFGPPSPLPDQPEGFGEPAVVELANGKCWMVFRTILGHLWQAFSTDGGLSWGIPTSTGLASPLSAVNAKRIPGSDSIVLIWNHVQPGPSKDFNHCPGLYRPRSPLVFSVSHNHGRSWSCPVIVEKGTGVYPSLFFSEKEMFLVYMSNPNPAVGSGVSYDITFAAYEKQKVLNLPAWTTETIKPYIDAGLVAHWLMLNIDERPASITNSL
jgi:sialidase-1